MTYLYTEYTFYDILTLVSVTNKIEESGGGELLFTYSLYIGPSTTLRFAQGGIRGIFRDASLPSPPFGETGSAGHTTFKTSVSIRL